MAKVKTKAMYGLRPGHPTPFRRTVKTGRKPYVLIFEPNIPLEVTAAEIEAIKKDIDKGMLVEWSADDADRRGRLRPSFPQESTTDAADATAREESGAAGDESTGSAE